MAHKAKDTGPVDVMRLDTAVLEVMVVGTTPMIYNAMSAHVQGELLVPAAKKNRSERATTAKHNPLREYSDSVYRSRIEDSDTLLVFPGGAAKASIMNAAVDIPGAAKAQVGRLVVVETVDIPVWGVPQLRMDVVRQAGMNAAPDVRTRATVPEWCARFRVRLVKPNLNEQAVANLIAAAGLIIGWGDYRPQKGKGAFGQFRLATEDDAEFARIVKTGGREAQGRALATPTFYDSEAEALYAHWETEVRRRELKVS